MTTIALVAWASLTIGFGVGVWWAARQIREHEQHHEFYRELRDQAARDHNADEIRFRLFDWEVDG